MSETLTKAAARNIFYGGTVFFFVVFTGLVAQSVHYANAITDKHPISADVAAGKRIFERHACFDCHTLYGEGARFAPELGNVWLRDGGDKDPTGARETLKAWFRAQPTGIAGRHQMPQFNLSDQELDQVIDFLQWSSGVDLQGWPPNTSG